jgi:hypothetical protein
MHTESSTERPSHRRKIVAAARGLGWRFSASRLRHPRTGANETPPRPRAAWLLATDGRPALATVRETD